MALHVVSGGGMQRVPPLTSWVLGCASLSPKHPGGATSTWPGGHLLHQTPSCASPPLLAPFTAFTECMLILSTCCPCSSSTQAPISCGRFYSYAWWTTWYGEAAAAPTCSCLKLCASFLSATKH